MGSSFPGEKPYAVEGSISQTPFFLLLDAPGRVIVSDFYKPTEIVEQHFL